MKEDDERTPLHLKNDAPVLYTRRWYIMMAFTLVCFIQNVNWVTYSPVAAAAAQYYGSTQSTMMLMTALGPIAFIPLALPAAWSVDKYGVRMTVILTAALVAAGGVLRCLRLGTFTIPMVFFAQFLNAAAGPVVMFLAPKISSVWMGPRERTVATALPGQGASLGVAAGFFMPLLFPDARDIWKLLYLDAILSIVSLLLILVYFPSRPPTPPSISSVSIKSESGSFKEVVVDHWKALKSRNVLLLVVGGCVGPGVYAGWSTMVVQILEALGIQGTLAMWFAVFNVFAGIVGGVAFGYVHDKFGGYKRILVGVNAGFVVIVLWQTLTLQGIVPGAYYAAVAANIIGGFLDTGAVIFEALVENLYPLPEQIGSNLYTIILNFWALLFLVAGAYIPPSFVYIMNWILVFSMAGTTLSMFLMKEVYTRKNVDKGPISAEIN